MTEQEVVPPENSLAGVIYDLRREVREIRERITKLETGQEKTHDLLAQVGNALNAIFQVVRGAGSLGRFALKGLGFFMDEPRR